MDDPQQRVAFLNTLEATFAQQGLTDIYAGAQRLTRLLDRMRTHIAAAHSRESFDAHLASMGPVDAESFHHIIALFVAINPIMQQFLLTAAQQTIDAQPRKTGPPVRITPQQKRAVIDYIASLYTKGVSTSVGQRRAALHFGLSLRSVQRICKQRQELAKQPFLSVEDVIKFFAE